MLKHLTVKTRSRTELVNITAEVKDLVRATNVSNGLCYLAVLHTTAGITVNEGADPAVQRDIAFFLNKLVPLDPYFTHSEGNSDAHIKSSLVGTSLTLIIDNARLVLGTWQAVYLCEFDGPRERKIALKIVADP
ncbi:MAG TPA: secondary thiamine-phosphate synthase enzyme YjbQ [Geobacteraceae bacterium]